MRPTGLQLLSAAQYTDPEALSASDKSPGPRLKASLKNFSWNSPGIAYSSSQSISLEAGTYG